MVREVNDMEKAPAQVHAWSDNDTHIIECTACGPLGVALDVTTTDATAIVHMQDVHGAEYVTH